jgi:hypothetical protein
MDKGLLDEFLKEGRVTPKAKLEAFLAPYLGLRPMSQVTIPAELPDGPEMGQTIDSEMKPELMKLQTMTDMKARSQRVQTLKKVLEQKFEEVVEGSDSYKAYYHWSESLGLRKNQVKVRPSVHEIYFFKEKSTIGKLRGLMREREKIKRKVQRKPGPNTDSIMFAYPEEFDKKWLLKNGALLGYPDCCVKQYADDRVKGVNAEARASKQLIEALQAGEVDSHVYFTGYFFPCSPHCEKALETGIRWEKEFENLSPEVSELYQSVLLMNAELVLRQPEFISKYLGQLKKMN